MIIQERFGNTDKIAHELTQVHKKISIQEIGWIMGLSWAISTIAISFLHALQNCSVDSAAMCYGGSLIASIAAPLVFLFPLIAIFFDQFFTQLYYSFTEFVMFHVQIVIVNVFQILFKFLGGDRNYKFRIFELEDFNDGEFMFNGKFN